MILGVDLSLVNTACITLKNGKIIRRQQIKSKPSGDKPIDELKRIIEIRDQIKTDNIELAVIEGLAFSIRKTRAIMQLAALNYFVREKLMNLKIPFIIVSPPTLKKFITGRGNSPKDIMLLATFKKYKIYFTDDNLCDAFGLAMCGSALLNQYPFKLNKPQIEVINILKKQL